MICLPVVGRRDRPVLADEACNANTAFSGVTAILALFLADRFEVTALKGEKLGLSVAGISKPDKFNPLGTGEVRLFDGEIVAAADAKFCSGPL